MHMWWDRSMWRCHVELHLSSYELSECSHMAFADTFWFPWNCFLWKQTEPRGTSITVTVSPWFWPKQRDDRSENALGYSRKCSLLLAQHDNNDNCVITENFTNHIQCWVRSVNQMWYYCTTKNTAHAILWCVAWRVVVVVSGIKGTQLSLEWALSQCHL